MMNSKDKWAVTFDAPKTLKDIVDESEIQNNGIAAEFTEHIDAYKLKCIELNGFDKLPIETIYQDIIGFSVEDRELNAVERGFFLMFQMIVERYRNSVYAYDKLAYSDYYEVEQLHKDLAQSVLHIYKYLLLHFIPTDSKIDISEVHLYTPQVKLLKTNIEDGIDAYIETKDGKHIDGVVNLTYGIKAITIG